MLCGLGRDPKPVSSRMTPFGLELVGEEDGPKVP